MRSGRIPLLANSILLRTEGAFCQGPLHSDTRFILWMMGLCVNKTKCTVTEPCKHRHCPKIEHEYSRNWVTVLGQILDHSGIYVFKDRKQAKKLTVWFIAPKWVNCFRKSDFIFSNISAFLRNFWSHEVQAWSQWKISPASLWDLIDWFSQDAHEFPEVLDLSLVNNFNNFLLLSRLTS